MRVLRLFTVPAALVAMALPAAADKIPLSELSRYLNGLTTAEAEFTQVNSDGTISVGTLYLRRPGRARFEYAAPDNSLVIAGGGQVAVFDPKSNQPPEQYPLKKTPLSLILDANVDLGRARMVVGHSGDDQTTSLVAQDPEHPEYGNIRLVFTANPTELRQWVITDDAGGETTVILGDMEVGKPMGSLLFDITHETQKRLGRQN